VFDHSTVVIKKTQLQLIKCSAKVLAYLIDKKCRIAELRLTRSDFEHSDE